jgi:hypothetical protein
VTNWADYDRARVNRGHLMIGFDEARIKDHWTLPPVGRGKLGMYSGVAIQTSLTLKTLCLGGRTVPRKACTSR